MRIYTVHTRHLGATVEPETVFVKEGFCWPAALFTLFWALSQRMWFAALVLLLAQIALGLLLEWAPLASPSETAISIGFLAILGCLANDWRRCALARRGFDMEDIVYARNLAGAEWRHLEKQERAGWR